MVYDVDFVRFFFDTVDELQLKVEMNARDKFAPVGRGQGLFPSGYDLFWLSAKGRFYASGHGGTSELCGASDLMGVVASLEKRGYELTRSYAMALMGYLDVTSCRGEHEQLYPLLHEDEDFAARARELRLSPRLTLHEAISLRPVRAAKRLAPEDYREIEVSMSRFDDLAPGLKSGPFEKLLSEIMWRRFYRGWALDSFLQLVHYRLPILCCEMVFDHLSNDDLYEICMAASGDRPIDVFKKSP
ncbi:hypothetical protein TKK_0007125 [Trichogramma kaykai]